MKKLIFISALSFLCYSFASGQIICIMCYDQNDSISDNVTNLVKNGGFESNSGCTPNSNSNSWCPNSANFTCTITNWTCTGGGASTYASIFDNTYTVIPQGNYAPYFGNAFCQACSPTVDDTSCITTTQCEVSGIPNGYPVNTSSYGGTTGLTLKQTVNGFTIGNTYVLEFWTGGEDFNVFLNKGVFGVDLGFGYTMLRTKPSGPGKIGTRFIIEFKATATSHTLMFTNWGHICSSCSELILDNVRIYPLSQLDSSIPSCSTTLSSSINKTDILCKGQNNGVATVTAISGTSSYTYTWSNGASTISTSTNNTISPLAPNSYTVTITDAASNTSTATVTINEPLTSVGGSTSVITNTTCGNSNGSAKATAAGGTGILTYVWSNGQSGITAITLPAATYTVTVYDANGCSITSTATIQNSNGPSISIVSFTNTCQGKTDGAVTTQSAGVGLTYLWSDGSTTPDLINIAGAVYTVTVTDGTGCTATTSVNVVNYPSPPADAGIDQTITIGQSIQLNASGGTIYLWGASSSLSNTSISNPVANPTQTTTYTVTVTDANNCTAMNEVTITVVEPIILCGAETSFLPTAFSPNNDGENDVLYVRAACIKTLLLQIFDRWGQKIFETTNPVQGWDGAYKGKPMDTGLYTYVIRVKLLTGLSISRNGAVTLLR